MVIMLLAGFGVHQQADAQQPHKASTSRAAREEARRTIPFERLPQDVQQRLSYVVSKPSLYRKLPVQILDSDPDMFVYLVRYPEIVINMWQLMGVTNVEMDRTAAYTFHATDGAGTTTDVELVYGSNNLHIYHASGYYEGPLLRNRVNGSSVILLSSGYFRGADGRPYVSCRMDVFIRLDHPAADLIAKTLQPLVGKTADHNFAEATRFLGEVSRAAETRWEGMQNLIPKLSNVHPNVRSKFSTIANSVQTKHAALQAGTGPNPIRVSSQNPPGATASLHD